MPDIDVTGLPRCIAGVALFVLYCKFFRRPPSTHILVRKVR